MTKQSREAYAPGSICDLQPKTSSAEVKEFLAMMDLSEKADQPLYLRSLVPGRTVLLDTPQIAEERK